ncbi:EAL domain-containing protein [Methylomonas sp. SURF-1]|uniref:EAL domain-containing protein n=1 Tax=Methylomonas aurea TaxID=2952224 RepID=A0ABT1UN39_9GAMM|nr:EAL domain-containing protein [Methylomonas sp. SURF-1]MCQ8182826.1 EAL domain-containing protein [Methylomonas sp. SURF-1]
MPVFFKPLISNSFFALAYFIGGFLGHMLSMPPSQASAIWPPAGIALAGMLHSGRKVLPGLAVGAIAVQIYAFSGLGAGQTPTLGYWMGTAAGIAACGQAWLGAFLINRWIGPHNPLLEDRHIVHFFVLAIASCLLAPTLGSSLLYLLGCIEFSDIGLNWSTWWVGDSIGAVIFAPMLLAFIAAPRHIWRQRQQFVVYPLAATLILVVVAVVYSSNLENRRIRELFESQTSLLHQSIQQHFDNDVLNNQLLKALFDSSDSVDRNEFRLFAHTIFSQHPELEVLEWLPKVRQSQRAEFEEREQIRIVDREVEGAVKTAAERDYYLPVTYWFGNEQNLGLDALSRPELREAIEKAIASGKTSATSGLAFADGQFGFAVFSPIYSSGKPLNSLQQRQEHLRGLVANVFRLSSEVAEIVSRLEANQLALSIYDADRLLYGESTVDAAATPFAELHQQLKLKVADRLWAIHYRPSAQFYAEQRSWTVWWLLSGSFLLCGLTSFGLMLMTGRTARIEDLVALKTRDLLRSNQALNSEIERRKQQENELRIAAATFQSHEAIMVTDTKGIVLRVNDAFSRITGYSAAEVVGRRPDLLSKVRQAPGLLYGLFRALLRKNQWRGEIWNRRKNGDVFPEWLTVTGVRDESGKLLNYVAIFSDISEQKAAEREIHELAFYDPLTGLPNRRLLLDRLKQEIAAAKRQHCYGALFFLDLDHFKTLNDSRGHQVGDELLTQVAQRLRAIIREEDTACRLGGDEFIVMVPGRYREMAQATHHAVMLAEKILHTINQPFNVQGSEHHFSTSIGVTLFPEAAEQPEAVIQQADTAMYRAKESGRNGISFYRPSMQETADRRLTLEKEIRQALKEQQFVLHYQPQVDDSGRVVSAEALIRWQHPQRGMISPAEFIPIAEDTRLILPLGEWVIRETCRQIGVWDRENRAIGHVAVNVSSRQFRQPDFVEQIERILADASLSADRLVIELTEGSVISNIDDTVRKMRDLQTLGVKTSIDDFGIGYSSLSYLKTLPISQLKIDQSFVKDLPEDQNDAVIVETIINMAKSLRLHVIAEGVETEEQVRFLREKGCLSYQGYHIGRPVPAADFRN